MKHHTWITSAIAAGGTLSMSGPIKNNRILRARMDWPDEKPVVGAITMSIEDALDKLEEALADDAANEMMETGAA